MTSNAQIDFWSGEFGKNYTERNSRLLSDWNKFYMDTWGVSKIEMNESFVGGLDREIKILEVGCNTGMQLNGLQSMGFKKLYGIELQTYAVKESKNYTENINIIYGSGFDIPFKDNYFDVVCTNGLLIHIAPENLPAIFKEMYRCSSKYIWGFEYYADQVTPIEYRGHINYMWKANYADLLQKQFPGLKLIKEQKYPYVNKPANVDCMFLLEK